MFQFVKSVHSAPGRLSHGKQQIGACRTGVREGMKGCIMGRNLACNLWPSAPWQFGLVMWIFTFSSDLERLLQKDTTRHRHFSARRANVKSRRGCRRGQSFPTDAHCPPSGSPSPHLADRGTGHGMWRMLLLCWMCMWVLSGKDWGGLSF